jgi:hypothetical protein
MKCRGVDGSWTPSSTLTCFRHRATMKRGQSQPGFIRGAPFRLCNCGTWDGDCPIDGSWLCSSFDMMAATGRKC